ncbi:MAG: EutN/CcmL family microcompartment protein [Ignavibacteriaceae bacterium]
MKLGKVIGVVWASKKVKEIDGCRMYIIQPVSTEGKNTGNPVVAADPQNIASSGDSVVYVTSTDAVQAFDSGFAPVNASVVALVDEVS